MPEVEIVQSGYSRKKDTVHQQVMAELEEMKKKSFEQYQDFEVEEGAEKEKYLEAIEIIKQDLVDLYEFYGVTIAADNFPEFQLIDANLLPSDDGDETTVGDHGSLSGAVRFFVKRGPRFLEDIRNIYHELHHAVGRKAIAVNSGNAKYPRFRLERSGYVTEVKHKIKDKGPSNYRGKVIEEGLSEFLATSFALNSRAPLVAAARETYHEETELDLELVASPQYNNSRKIIELISAKAAEENPERQVEILKLLVSARLDPSLRRELTKEIDRLFGKRIGRRLLQASFTEKNVAELLEEMKAA